MTEKSPQSLLQHNMARGKALFLAVDPKVRWPLMILLVAVISVVLIQTFKPNLAPIVVERTITGVRVITVEPQAIQLTVRSQGTVQPRIASNLTSEVSGSVVYVAPALVAGGHFDKGDLLLEIGNQDYRNIADRAKASVELARVEHEVAESEYRRQERLLNQNLASRSQLEQADRAFRAAEAGLIETRINLEQAQLDLARTKIYAPFTGRVRSESVDVGQFVGRGATVAAIYAVDAVEIRLPIANKQFAYLDIPRTARGILDAQTAPGVSVQGSYGGENFSWAGSLVRTEAEIDEKTRMFYGVARVENPADTLQIPALIVGLFVDAEIAGRVVENVVRLPRSAMRDDNHVLIVDADDRLRFREVEPLRIEYDEVLIASGLAAGERVCISPIQVVVDGMRIQPIDVTPGKDVLEAPDENPEQLRLDATDEGGELLEGGDTLAPPAAVDGERGTAAAEPTKAADA